MTDTNTIRRWAEAAGLEVMISGPPSHRINWRATDGGHAWSFTDPALIPLIAEKLVERVIARDESAVNVAFQHLTNITAGHIRPEDIPSTVLGQWMRATAAQRAAAAFSVLQEVSDEQ